MNPTTMTILAGQRHAELLHEAELHRRSAALRGRRAPRWAFRSPMPRLVGLLGRSSTTRSSAAVCCA